MYNPHQFPILDYPIINGKLVMRGEGNKDSLNRITGEDNNLNKEV